MSELNKNGKEKQGRLIALIIAGSVLFWSVLQGVAPSLGIAARYMLLIDFFTLCFSFNQSVQWHMCKCAVLCLVCCAALKIL